MSEAVRYTMVLTITLNQIPDYALTSESGMEAFLDAFREWVESLREFIDKSPFVEACESSNE